MGFEPLTNSLALLPPTPGVGVTSPPDMARLRSRDVHAWAGCESACLERWRRRWRELREPRSRLSSRRAETSISGPVAIRSSKAP